MNSKNKQYSSKKTNIILIDNFDSFTYNLVNQLRPLVNSLTIYRNSTPLATIEANIKTLSEDCIIVISPGPGDPDTAGITLELINLYKGKLPILGICLGHQAIIQSYSGKVGAAQSIVHGKGFDINIDDPESGIFDNLKSPFRAARYHSLAATKMPPTLKVIAQCDGDVMAVRHQTDKILGFQFHPESILTPKGNKLMANALKWLSC